MAEYRRIHGLLDKIRSTGMGGVSSDDGNALAKLRANLESREQAREKMKAVNAYYRKCGTLQGCPLLTPEDAAKLEVEMSRSYRQSPKPYESFLLSNNNAEIRRLRARIEELEQRQAAPAPEGWAFNGGEVVMNSEENRVQIIFHDKLDADVRAALKQSGFRWAPSQGAWQRMLNQNGVYAARQVIPDEVRKDVRIPANAKLCAWPGEQEGTVTVAQADYRYDLTDVPEWELSTLAMMGVCLGELEERLMAEDIVYG